MKTAKNKSLLITVRDTNSSTQGVRFVSSFFHHPENLLCTLFYIIPKATSSQSMLDPWAEEHQNIRTLPPGVEKTFTVCSTVLKEKGFSEEQIQKIARNKQTGTIQDIIKEGQRGLYDALIFGKKSATFLENILYGNKGYEILEKELSNPVWFCRNPAINRKNVLLCLDGSPLGTRVADHVGFILEGEHQHSVTLLHVDKGQGVDTSKTFQEAASVLHSYGISEKRISRSTVKSTRVARTLLEAAEQGDFAALAIGSVGQTAEKGLYEGLIGSKCRNIFDKIDKCTLWITP